MFNNHCFINVFEILSFVEVFDSVLYFFLLTFSLDIFSLTNAFLLLAFLHY